MASSSFDANTVCVAGTFFALEQAINKLIKTIAVKKRIINN
jgi:hypothetical protein